ncbi:hypothetical protein MCOR25_003381 [Pyricularia grisea]|uniref:Ecp2 effector protein domain-containing protein n=1 Tax=Pyricularia grisea TaxID=148305 RepID=A0A6P8BDN4_PYRGI|nr:uncharacterized protein PgNI_03122 [Pyricularia grisea]KAI6373753.1 hypothetical protein MCOR25_003381 [Pyricularia grisea]TLD13981.1 hypothetical protein PgNI_03122 [Pyricularia grisea]
MQYQTIFTSILLAISAMGANARPMPHGHKNVGVPQEHFEVLKMRASNSVNSNAVTDVKCIDPNARIVFHDQNVAELAICGGIAGSITKCQGSPQETTGESGSAKFELKAAQQGATINISKGRWEQCVRAARDACPTGTMSGTCVGGASSGDVNFTLNIQ